MAITFDQGGVCDDVGCNAFLLHLLHIFGSFCRLEASNTCVDKVGVGIYSWDDEIGLEQSKCLEGEAELLGSAEFRDKLVDELRQ